jgi:chorismate mutase
MEKFRQQQDQHYFEKKGRRLFYIAGPCSAESPEQMIQTAISLKHAGVHLLRAGVWKPRTRPGHFEGKGEVSLAWLKEASLQTGLPVAAEVILPKHAEQALKAEIDVLWIGARTTVNPVMVQELSEALKGADIPVMVKNPVNPDLELWIGAIERFARSGIKSIAAVHRGFSSYEKNAYRNHPKWEIPIELKRRMPDLPLICDPSHICGNTQMIRAVAQTAIDLDYDGLMIEVHPEPEAALSDVAQQLTPDGYAHLIHSLVLRKSNPDAIEASALIAGLREQIDAIDRNLIELLSERMDLARRIGQFKKERNVKILQPPRWEEIVKSRSLEGIQKKLDPGFVFALFEIIHREAIEQQAGVMNSPDDENVPMS